MADEIAAPVKGYLQDFYDVFSLGRVFGACRASAL